MMAQKCAAERKERAFDLLGATALIKPVSGPPQAILLE
jgi:hypothetical protein